MNIPRPTTIDRIHYARKLATGKRVLDIGGQKMPDCEITSPFAIEYAKIQRASSDYRILDYQQKPEVNYVLDLNTPGKIDHLKEILDEFSPEVILCMEVLEHINYPCAVMDVIADYTDKHPCVTFILSRTTATGSSMPWAGITITPSLFFATSPGVLSPDPVWGGMK